jgi:hypothetical protein
MLAGDLWDEVNHPERGHKGWNTPGMLADKLARSSPAFQQLRQQADVAVQGTRGRDLAYQSGGSGSHTAGYADGKVRIAASHPAMAAQNIVFETANAAQTRFFDQVESDHLDKSITGKDIAHYAALLGRPAGELDAFADEYDKGDAIKRRSLLQEWAEWNSLALSRTALEDIRKNMKGATANELWEEGFGSVIQHKDFNAYYKARGRAHRTSVELALRPPERIELPPGLFR